MRFRTRTWVVISVLCFLMAGIFWQLSARLERRAAGAAGAAAAANGSNGPAGIASSNVPAGVQTNVTPLLAPAVTARTNAANVAAIDPFAHRLANTTQPLDVLMHSEQ